MHHHRRRELSTHKSFWLRVYNRKKERKRGGEEAVEISGELVEGITILQGILKALPPICCSRNEMRNEAGLCDEREKKNCFSRLSNFHFLIIFQECLLICVNESWGFASDAVILENNCFSNI